jgi:hypothetical protein
MELFQILKRAFRRSPDIPRDIFVEDLIEEPLTNPINNTQMEYSTNAEGSMLNGKLNHRKLLDDFLAKDAEFELKGYNDALVEQDSSNMKAYTDILKLQLRRVSENVIFSYSDDIREDTVKKRIADTNGMRDDAELIEVRMNNSQEQINRINQMLTDVDQSKGIGHILILAYEQGFKRGIASKLFK